MGYRERQFIERLLGMRTDVAERHKDGGTTYPAPKYDVRHILYRQLTPVAYALIDLNEGRVSLGSQIAWFAEMGGLIVCAGFTGLFLGSGENWVTALCRGIMLYSMMRVLTTGLAADLATIGKKVDQ